MLNRASIIGRLGKDPELKYGASGMAVCRFSVATDESYTKDGQRQDRTEWHNIIVFNKAAENCGIYLKKGSLVYIEGSLATDKWTDKNGVDRYTTSIKAQRIQFLDKKDNGQNAGQNAGQNEDLGPALPSEATNSMDNVPF